jgi:hypothetical protein
VRCLREEGRRSGRLSIGRRICFDGFAVVAGDFEGLDHDLGAVVTDGAGRELDAVAHEVVLERVDGERVLRFERREAAL